MNRKEQARFEKLVSALRRSESERANHEGAWNDYQCLYTNQDPAQQRKCSERKVNLAFQTVEIMVSAPLDRYPKIYAAPRKPSEIPKARLAEKVLALWEDVNRTSVQVENAHRDAAVFGDGFLKTAWIRQSSRRVEPDPGEYQEMLAKRDELELKLGQILTDRDIYEYLADATIQVVDNKPVTRRVSIWDIWVDMQAKQMADIAWIAHRYQRPLEDVKSDPGFRYKTRKNVAMNQLGSNHNRGWGDDVGVGGLDMVEIIEIWDLHQERLYIADYTQLGDPSQVLYEGSFPYAIGAPFTHVPFYELPDQVYSMGVIELIAPLQQELNDIREEMTQARARMRQKFASIRGLLDQDGIDALQSDIDGDVVTVDPDVLDGRNLSEVLVPLVGKGVNAELYNQSGVIQSDIYNVTGVTEYQRGLVSNYRSATEVNTVNNFTSARLARMIRNVHFARLDVARKEIGLAAQFMEQEEVLRIVGQDADLLALPGAFSDGRSSLFPFNRKDIAGEYSFHLEAGSYDPESKQMRLDRLMQVMALLSQFPELERKQVIEEIVTELGLVDPGRFLAEIPQPIQGFSPPAGSGAPSVGGGRPGGSAAAEMDPSTKPGPR